MGGYRVLDLKNTNFTSGTASTVSGVYDFIAKYSGKPVLISGLVVGGVNYPGLWANFGVASGVYTAYLYGFGNIKISSGDSVTVTKA